MYWYIPMCSTVVWGVVLGVVLGIRCIPGVCTGGITCIGWNTLCIIWSTLCTICPMYTPSGGSVCGVYVALLLVCIPSVVGMRSSVNHGIHVYVVLCSTVYPMLRRVCRWCVVLVYT
jgi:hypothetical protein